MRSHRFTKAEMKRVGVEVVDESRILLRCMTCGQTWSPDLQAHGKLPRGYWKCPNGCNASQGES